jgi:hypothetical protein
VAAEAVVAFEQSHVGPGVGQVARGREAAEAAADDSYRPVAREAITHIDR